MGKLCRRCGFHEPENVRISAYQGVGIDKLLDTLSRIVVERDLLASSLTISPTNTHEELRMAIAIIDGNKVYGKVLQGIVEENMKVRILPTNQEVMIKEVHPDYLLLSSPAKAGDFLITGEGRETSTLLCDIYSFDFLITGTKCMLHIHTAVIPCEIKIVKSPTIKEKSKGQVIIYLESPIFTEKGTRWANIALRNSKTLAIGTVTGIRY